MTRLRSILLSTLVLAVASLATGSASAADPAGPTDRASQPRVNVTLLTDHDRVVPGETFRVGVRFEMEPGWHVYWKHAGDTGKPTNVDFSAADGFHFGALEWPTPHRYVDKIGGVSYGYADEVLLAATVRAPDDLAEGDSVTLGADVAWLVCQENCINGKATLSVTRLVASGEPTTRRSGSFAAFEAAAAAVPATSAPDYIVESALVALDAVAPGQPFVVRVDVRERSGATVAWPADTATAFLPAPAKGLNIRGVERVDSPDGAPGTISLHVKGQASATAKFNGAVIDGVIQLVHGDKTVAFDTRVAVPRKDGPVPAVSEATAAAPAIGAATPTIHADTVCADVGAGSAGSGALSSFWIALLFAFIGGILLNAMPCVLPVISLKVLSIVEQSGEDRKVIWRHGLVYTAGVLLSFLALAVVLLAVKATNWAFQLQDPVFVAVLVALLFAFALSLFGVFQISMPGATRIDQAVAGSKGYVSSFNYGIFAVVLGTPCTAPFLGPAMAYALSQPPVVLCLLLLAVGLGLAFPFLLLARFPQWKRILPKPGPWLTTFKKSMGFLLVGTAIFFLYTFQAQVSAGAFMSYLIFLTLLAMALWILGQWGAPWQSMRSRVIGKTVALALVVASSVMLVSTEPPPQPPGMIHAGGIWWHNFDTVDVEAEARAGKTVFIDFTAEWCSTCKVNEATAIYTDSVREAFAALDIMPVKADFTVAKPSISAWLKRFNEPSVPLYVVLPAGRPDEAKKLPTFPLSTGDIVSAICAARPDDVRTAAR